MRRSAISRVVPVRVILGLLFGVAVTLLWAGLLLEGSAGAEKPHHVPVAVVGPPPATALQTAQAASTVAPITPILQQIVSSPPLGLHIATSDIKPLPPGDPSGLGLFFTCFAFVFGGVPAGVALALTMRKRRPTSLDDAGVWLGLIGSYSILLALGVALLAEIRLGYEGHQFLIIWGWGTLVSAAAMGSTAAAIAALGLPGALLPVIAVQFFGVPAAPLPGPWNFEPGLFRVLGPFDPMGAGADAIRNSIFFRSASQSQDAWVLVLWTVVPLLLLVGIGWRSQRRAAWAVRAPPDGVSAVKLEPTV